MNSYNMVSNLLPVGTANTNDFIKLLDSLWLKWTMGVTPPVNGSFLSVLSGLSLLPYETCKKRASAVQQLEKLHFWDKRGCVHHDEKCNIMKEFSEIIGSTWKQAKDTWTNVSRHWLTF